MLLSSVAFFYTFLFVTHRKDFHGAPAVLPVGWLSYNTYLHQRLPVHTAHPSRVCLHLIQHHHIPCHDSHQVRSINWLFHYVIPKYFIPSLKHKCPFIIKNDCWFLFLFFLQHCWVSYCKAGMLREIVREFKLHAVQDGFQVRC